MSHLLAPQIVILKEGTDDHEGRGQIVSNINACAAVVDVVKTTLGKFARLLFQRADPVRIHQGRYRKRRFVRESSILLTRLYYFRSARYGQTHPHRKRSCHL